MQWDGRATAPWNGQPVRVSQGGCGSWVGAMGPAGPCAPEPHAGNNRIWLPSAYAESYLTESCKARKTVVRQLARVVQPTGSQDSRHVKSEKLAWKKTNDTIFRVLEVSTGGGIGCGGTPDADKGNIKSENFARYQKFNSLGCMYQLQMRRLASEGDLSLHQD